MRSDIERVVSYMYERYNEPISLNDMAEVARLSQFHFSRTFLAVTGVSPGRFLSAIRLHRAKDLLLKTTETVTSISYLVGYNSLGTFTTRFTRSVGISPNQFRRASGFFRGIPAFDQARKECPRLSAEPMEGHGHAAWVPYKTSGSIGGEVSVPPQERINRVFLGLFVGAIAQGPLVAGAVLDGSGGLLEFRLPVPEGEWYVLAIGADADKPDRAAARVRMVAREGPVKVIDGDDLHVRLTMRGIEPTDPPILLALPDFEMDFEVN